MNNPVAHRFPTVRHSVCTWLLFLGTPSDLLNEPLLLCVRIEEINPDDPRLFYLTFLGTIALRAA